MRLALFYATGLTGIQLIEQELFGWNQVIAYACNPSIIGTRYERLVIVEGELSDDEAIKQTVNDTEAVINMLDSRLGEDRNGRPLSLCGLHPD